VRVEARVSVRLFARADPACYANEEDDMHRDSIRIAAALDNWSLKRSPPVFLRRRASLGSHPVQIAASSAMRGVRRGRRAAPPRPKDAQTTSARHRVDDPESMNKGSV
jgi:hypothetical protein